MSKEFKNLDLDTRNSSIIFREGCCEVDFNKIKSASKLLAQKNMKFLNNELDEGLIFAAKNSYIQLIKFLLTSEDLDHHAFIHANDGAALDEACENGYLDIVKYLLESKELNRHAYLNSSAFTNACATDQIEVVKYLLTPKFKNQINMDVIFSGLVQTCRYGSRKSLQYIWENTDVKNSKQLDNNLAAVFGLAYLENHLEVVHYMIFDLYIKKDELVNGYLNTKPNEQVNQWFELRQLNNDLSQDLIKSHSYNRKVKL